MGEYVKEIKINSAIKKVVEENAVGLASVDKNGNPHNVAVAYVKVVSENELIITDNFLEETLENIKNNSNVALVVWNKEWENVCLGYEVIGKVEYFTEGEWIDFVKKIPENDGMPCKGAILVNIEKIKVLS